MKRILLFFLVTLTLQGKSQITWEHTYDSASVWNTCLGNIEQLLLVNFEISGEHYVKINRCGRVLNIYNLNHSLVQTISMSTFPWGSPPPDILYLSENLFDLDPDIEFMYLYPFNGFYATNIYNHDGTILFSDTGAALIKPNWHMQQFPIYNTSQGAKMILSYANNQAKVFGLPGTLTTAIHGANQNLLEAQERISNPAPNPTNGKTRINYTLPKEVSQGEIVFYDLQGVEIKRFKVDNTFDHLLLSTEDIPAGTYFYKLISNGIPGISRKIVVVK